MDALERDFYEERRRKWRRSAFWRGFFVALFLLIALGVALSLTGLETARDHVARVSIDGFIGESRERLGGVCVFGEARDLGHLGGDGHLTVLQHDE